MYGRTTTNLELSDGSHLIVSDAHAYDACSSFCVGYKGADVYVGIERYQTDDVAAFDRDTMFRTLPVPFIEAVITAQRRASQKITIDDVVMLNGAYLLVTPLYMPFPEYTVRQGPCALPPGLANVIVAQMAADVAQMHARNITHNAVCLRHARWSPTGQVAMAHFVDIRETYGDAPLLQSRCAADVWFLGRAYVEVVLGRAAAAMLDEPPEAPGDGINPAPFMGKAVAYAAWYAAVQAVHGVENLEQLDERHPLGALFADLARHDAAAAVYLLEAVFVPTAAKRASAQDLARYLTESKGYDDAGLKVRLARALKVYIGGARADAVFAHLFLHASPRMRF
jgi:hypothetical protein